MDQSLGHCCPRCRQGIAEDRISSGVIICNACGYVLSNSERAAQHHSHRAFVLTVCGIGIAIFATLWQVTLWDAHALEVSRLQIRELAGVITDSDHERMAEICLERKRFDCVEREYARLSKRDLAKMFRLAKFQVGQHRWDAALQTFTAFFQKGGSDAEAAFLFARVLAHQGRNDEASQYFKYVLDSKTDAILKSAATEGYAQTTAGRQLAGQLTR